MWKTTLLSLAFASSLVACIADGAEEETLSEAESAELVPIERCPDLLNQRFELLPAPCWTTQGEPGRKAHWEICDIYRSIRVGPGFPPQITCGIDDSDCVTHYGTCVAFP